MGEYELYSKTHNLYSALGLKSIKGIYIAHAITSI